MKTIRLGTRLTPEQDRLLHAKARASGYPNTADYVRSVLFLSESMEEKIDKIYRKVCKNG